MEFVYNNEDTIIGKLILVDLDEKDIYYCLDHNLKFKDNPIIRVFYEKI